MSFRPLVPVVMMSAAACSATPSSAPPAHPSGASTGSAGPVGRPATPDPDGDPVRVGLTADGIAKFCDEHIANATALLASLKTLKGASADALTYEATLGRFDDIVHQINFAGEFPYLMGVAHPDGAVREAAKSCEPKTDKFMTALWLDADVAAVIKAFAAKSEKLEGERARLLTDVLRDFRRNGLELPPEKQQRLRELNESITLLGQKFMSNIGSSTDAIKVKPSSLEGLPQEFVAKHPPNANGLVEITTDYPDYFPFVEYSKDRKAALELYVKFTNRGGEENVRLLDQLLRLRHEKAKLLGYATWADYAIEPRMAKNAKMVREFLEKVRAATKEPAKAELTEFMREHVRLGGKATDKLTPPDRYYLEDRVRAEKYSFNSQELSNYFEIGAVKKGLMDLTARMYDLEYREVRADAWHPDVTAYEVYSHGEKIAKFYFDLYARPDKYKHAAMFTIRAPKRYADGRWPTPIAALVCNFPKPGEQPALLSHDEVVTFFHEFGHVLHHLLTRSELATYAGTNTVRDFVEAPSQMFEEWAWSRDVLDLFARHYKTGEKIPEALYAGMQKTRKFGRALATQRQVFLALLDLELHTKEPPFDTTKLVEQIQNTTDSFIHVKGTHFQSSFGHLIGYDAGYYGYQWALALSRDVLTRFKKEGLLNQDTARAWREIVLSKGGGVDERTMVAQFLGREPSYDAYIAYLEGKD